MLRAGKGFWISAAFLLASSLFDLIACPHSKVEESFQLQATHDLYYYGIGHAVRQQFSNLSNTTTFESLPYDHLQYPGGKAKISFVMGDPKVALVSLLTFVASNCFVHSCPTHIHGTIYIIGSLSSSFAALFNTQH